MITLFRAIKTLLWRNPRKVKSLNFNDSLLLRDIQKLSNANQHFSYRGLLNPVFDQYFIIFDIKNHGDEI